MFMNSRSVWNVRATPSRAMACGGRPAIDSADPGWAEDLTSPALGSDPPGAPGEQGRAPGEQQGEPVGVEDGTCVATSPRRCPSSPCGRAIIITIRIAPIISCRVIDGSTTTLVSQTNAAR